MLTGARKSGVQHGVDAFPVTQENASEIFGGGLRHGLAFIGWGKALQIFALLFVCKQNLYFLFGL